MNRPLAPATRVAFEKFLVAPQMTARKILPPSSGKPGRRLKRASQVFIEASQSAEDLTVSFDGKTAAKPKKSAASRPLESGPATAMLNSCMALEGSRSMLATPPKMNRVMERTRIL